jgi:PAS domain S-box-containing protein
MSVKSSAVMDGRLGASPALLSALVEALPLAVAIFDAELRLVRANARYLELTGLDADTADQRSIYDAFPNALADVAGEIDTTMQGSEPVALRLSFQQASGERVVDATFVPLVQDGAPAGLLFAGGDVTERERLREDLASSVAELESIFDVIPDSVRVVDGGGRTLRQNAQAQQEHGSTRATTMQELWQLDRPRRLDGTSLFVHEHPTARALQGTRIRGEVLSVRRNEGAGAVIEVSANPLRDPEGAVRGAVTVERDVTERVRLQRQLEEEARRTAELYERVSTEAERLERMVQERTQELLALQEARARERRLAAVGQLAAGVMHDVNNALNPIMAAAYLLEANAENPVAVRDYAVRIAKAAETGAATAARVGRFIRQDPAQGEGDELVDLATIADEVVAMTRPLWAGRAKGGTIRYESDLTPGAVVRGIPGELREALLNLVQNALDAMTGGGTLRIVTRNEGARAMVEVSDTGVGMSPEVRERAFDPFFTTKGRAGTGLGLAEVYGVAKRHRGVAEIESAPGTGTLVRLAFPLAVTPAPQQVITPSTGTPRRVLLVEDHPDSRDFVRAVLETEGHAVAVAGTVADALSRLESTVVPFDVLVTDIGLPDGSGWDLVAFARSVWPGIRVGVVTGWEPRPGAGPTPDFLLRKPVRTTELLDRVAGDRPASAT